MHTILVSAYDVNPYKGSESGSAWNFILQISKKNKAIIFTRRNNEARISEYVKSNNISLDNITFMYFDLPKWAMFWKRGPRFSSIYFYLWQMSLPVYVWMKKYKFDLAHNLNFHTDSVPTFLWLLGRPTVWGPINHNEPISRFYITKKDWLVDRAKWLFKRFAWAFDPFHAIARARVSLIIGANSSVQHRLGIDNKKFHKLTTIAASYPSIEVVTRSRECFHVAVVGRHIAIKSIDLAIKSFDRFYKRLDVIDRVKVKLFILGDGVKRTKFEALARSLSSSSAIEFVSWVPHSKVGEFYMDMDCFLNCSHEGAGAVVAEALSFGLPMVCFDNFGAGETVDKSCSLKVSHGSLESVVNDFSVHLGSLYHDKDKFMSLSKGALAYYESNLTWDAKGKKISKIYDKLLEKN